MIIYILKCIENKYYIGKSTKDIERIIEHFSGNGSAWTQIYKPIEVIETIEDADSFDEDKYTKQYMSKYGIDNVRGGSYSQINLDKLTKDFLENEINSSMDRCHRCGRQGHFMNSCNNDTHINGKKLDNRMWKCNHCSKLFFIKIDAEEHEKICKYKKKNFVDQISNFLIKSLSFLNNLISDQNGISEFNTRENKNIKNVNYVKKTIDYNQNCNNKNICYRCGRPDHWSSACYAKTHVKGYYLK